MIKSYYRHFFNPPEGIQSVTTALLVHKKKIEKNRHIRVYTSTLLQGKGT